MQPSFRWGFSSNLVRRLVFLRLPSLSLLVRRGGLIRLGPEYSSRRSPPLRLAAQLRLVRWLAGPVGCLCPVVLVHILAWHFVILTFSERFFLDVLTSGDCGEAPLQILSRIQTLLDRRRLRRLLAVLSATLRHLMLPGHRRLLLLNIMKS